MNIKIKNQSFIFEEGFYHKKGKDDLNKSYPKLHNTPRGYFNNNFLEKVERIEHYINQNISHSVKNKLWHCKLCNKHINFKIYKTKSLEWTSYFKHLIAEHNFTPSQNFINAINRLSKVKNTQITKEEIPLQYNSALIISKGIHRIFLNQNQLNILDALYEHGGGKKKYEDKKKHFYSEHSGFIDFNTEGIKRIIINTNKNRIDNNDPDILLPDQIDNMIDYEIYYHTHPSTPFPCYRMLTSQVLYEMPSVGDIYHFINYSNKGLTQASLVVAPEGMYIIKKISIDKTAKYFNLDKYVSFYQDAQDKYIKIYIDKFKSLYNKSYFSKKDLYDFYNKMFYKYIIHDTRIINDINQYIEKYNLIILYYPRRKKFQYWLLQELYIDINVMQPTT